MTWRAHPNVIIPFLRLSSAQVSSEVSGVRRALAVGSDLNDCLMLIIQQIQVCWKGAASVSSPKQLQLQREFEQKLLGGLEGGQAHGNTGPAEQKTQ